MNRDNSGHVPTNKVNIDKYSTYRFIEQMIIN